MDFAGRRPPARLRSLFEWMLHWGAAGRVQRLALTVRHQFPVPHNPFPVVQELAGVLAALLCACGTAGSLRELRTRHNFDEQSMSWLAAMSQLRLLNITAEDPTYGYADTDPRVYNPPSWSLAGLAELRLTIMPQGFHAPTTAHFPTSLTRLHLKGLRDEALPAQVRQRRPCMWRAAHVVAAHKDLPHASASLVVLHYVNPLAPQLANLSQLCELSLAAASPPAGGYSLLTALHGLRRLLLDSCNQLPACLPQLTWLEALTVAYTCDMDPPDDQECADSAGILQAALPALEGQLTCLALPYSLLGPPPLAPPSLLTACRGLQALFVDADRREGLELLPTGPAIPSLRHLIAPLDVLVGSLDVLQAGVGVGLPATLMTSLFCFSRCSSGHCGIQAFAAWPSLPHPTSSTPMCTASHVFKGRTQTFASPCTYRYTVSCRL